MQRFIIFSTLLLCCSLQGFSQHMENYNIVKTGNAFIMKPDDGNGENLELERISLECSTTELNDELHFSKIKNHFDDELITLFRNLKIKARVYINNQGEIHNLYFISEENPENYMIDYPRIDKIIRRKMRVEDNDNCVPMQESRYVSWYIPLFEL